MNFEEFRAFIKKWSAERGIYQYSTSQAQLMKTMEEMGELAKAELHDNFYEKLDAVGDVIVCLINYCELSGFSMEESFLHVWNTLKDRRGKMNANGAFVKNQ